MDDDSKLVKRALDCLNEAQENLARLDDMEQPFSNIGNIIDDVYRRIDWAQKDGYYEGFDS